MTRILLLRHGQASFGADDYDRLSEIGARQSRLAGRHLAAEGRSIQAVLNGSLLRQRDTARLAATEFGLRPHPLPDGGFDEYDAEALFESYLPTAVQREPTLDVPHAVIRGERRLFQLALSTVTGLWVTGAPGHRGETWDAFTSRIRAALEKSIDGCGHDDTILIATSGGVIGTIVADVMGLSGAAAMKLSWRIYNASITELGYGRSGFSLIGFNAVSHLRLSRDPALLTLR